MEGDEEAARSLLQGLPGVTEVRALDPCGSIVVLDGGEASPASLAFELHRAGFRVSRLLERKPDLEEAFIRLTRKDGS